MDPLTHGLTGALAGRTAAGNNARVSPAAAGWTTLAAAVFPDTEFAIALFDPYAYLTLHRAVTHSLLLLPLWAALVTWIAARASRYRWRELLPFAALGLVTHLVSDLFNIWDLKLLWPLSDAGISIPVLFVIDPWYTLMLLAGLVLTIRWRVRAGALTGLIMVVVYTAVQFPLSWQVERSVQALGDEAPEGELRVYALPYSPFARRVVVSDERGHSWVDINVISRRERARVSARAAPTGGNLVWQRVSHPTFAGAFAARAWQREEMGRFREFAELPYLYAQSGQCAWFADLRFALPGMEPPFRWGLCRSGAGEWTLDRLGHW